MNDAPRARPGSSRVWDRARRAYLAVLGDHDPAVPQLVAGALDLRLGYEPDEWDRERTIIVSGPEDFAELREVVETATGVGTWPRCVGPTGTAIAAQIAIERSAPLSGLLLAMEDLIDRRSPWGRWRTMVDTMGPRVARIDEITVDLRVIEPDR